MTPPYGLCVAALAMLGMEAVAYLAHRYVMHGWMWRWHASHHAPQRGWFELNDLFAVIFVLVSAALIHGGGPTKTAIYWVGWGMAGYGVVYALFHDGIVHRRIPLPNRLRQLPYLRHLARAHHLHHASHGQHGAVSYGFMVAPPLATLRRQFRAAAKARAAAASVAAR